MKSFKSVVANSKFTLIAEFKFSYVSRNSVTNWFKPVLFTITCFACLVPWKRIQRHILILNTIKTRAGFFYHPPPPPPFPTIPFRFQECWRELLGDILGLKETLELIVLGKLGYNLENRNVTISDAHVLVTVLLLMSSCSEHFHAKMHGFERARKPNTHVVSMCRAHFGRVVAVTWPNNFNDAIAPWLQDKSSNILFIFADLTVFFFLAVAWCFV